MINYVCFLNICITGTILAYVLMMVVVWDQAMSA